MRLLIPIIKVGILLNFLVLLFSIQAVSGPVKEQWEEEMLHDLKEILTQMEQNGESGSPESNYFYTGKNAKKNALFTASTKTEVNKHLYTLDSLGRKTIIYIGYKWFQYKPKNGRTFSKEDLKNYANALKERINDIYDTLQKSNTETANINLHVSLLMFVKTLSGNEFADQDGKWNQEVYIDVFKPRSDMNSACSTAVVNSINTAIMQKKDGATMSSGPNRAMIWRAKMIKENMRDCPLSPVQTGNSNTDLLAILAHIKETAAKEQKLIIHATPDGKPTVPEINATNIKVANTTYARIRYKSFAVKDPSFSDPLQYKTATDHTSNPKTASFIFSNRDSANKMLFSVSIFDDKNKEKKDSLAKYLFSSNEIISLELMQQIFPNAEDDFLQETMPFLNKYLTYFNIRTPCEVSHFLAQIGVEVGYFTQKSKLKENLKYTSCNIKNALCQLCYTMKSDDRSGCPTNKGDCSSRYDGKRKDMCNNPQEYAGDDEAIAEAAYDGYMGRGFIHLTWKNNYRDIYNYLLSQGLNPKNFYNDPSILSSDIETAMMSACGFFVYKGCLTHATNNNFEGVMNIVNASDPNKSSKISLLNIIKSKIKGCN